MTLGNEFRVFKKVRKILHVKEEINSEEVAEVISVQEGDYLLIALYPGTRICQIILERLEAMRPQTRLSFLR